MKEENNDNDEDDNTLFRVAMCQFHVTENKEENLQTCAKYIDQAMSPQQQEQNKKPHLIVLPEIWNSPYATTAFPHYAEIVPNVEDDNNDNEEENASLSPSVELLRNKAREHQVWIVGGSIPERVFVVADNDNDTTTTKKEELYYNTCLVFSPSGQLVAKHRKVHLFDIDIPNGITFKESETLSAGTLVTSFSPTPFCCNIGIGICYDIRFAEYAMVLTNAPYHCNVLIYPGAFNMVTGPAHWELLQRSRALDNQCYVITASPARSTINNNDTTANTTSNKYPPYTAWGHSTVVSPWGEVIATTDETPGIVVAELDLAKVTSIRQSIPIRTQKRHDLYTLQQPPPTPK